MKTILVVEDFIALQHFIRETLESAGYKTLGANDSNKASEVLRNHAHGIDLIIANYYGKGEAALNLVEQIKQNPVTAQKPVLFLSGEKNIATITRATGLHNASWILKPYKPEALFAKIENVLGIEERLL
jgi:DNA-binding response OmpR family regulator